MSDLSERIANLSPEKRHMLMQRLGKSPSPSHEERTREEAGNRLRGHVAEQRRNFRLDIARPGTLESLFLRDVERVAPKRGQVEIEVRAASLNFRDLLIALGAYPADSGGRPVMGSDCSGKIVAVGEEVTELAPGDEVIAMSPGTFSRYATAPACAVLPKPVGMTFEEAAAIPTVFVTAYYGLLYLARLAKGERVLIHSAAGGVGLAAIQTARLAGADVFATAGTPEKRRYVGALEVKHVADSRSLEFASDVMKATGGEGIDVVLNSLAGDAIAKGLEILRPLGRFVELGVRDIYQDHPLGLSPFRKGLSFFSVVLGPLMQQTPVLFQSLFREIMDRFESGVFNPLPVRAYPISSVVTAFNYMAQAAHIGKIVIAMTENDD